jgi:hypothetical protein
MKVKLSTRAEFKYVMKMSLSFKHALHFDDIPVLYLRQNFPLNLHRSHFLFAVDQLCFLDTFECVKLTIEKTTHQKDFRETSMA